QQPTDWQRSLPETIHQRPMCALLWRLLDVNDDKVTAGSLWNDVCSRKMAFRPTVWLFRQFSIRIINVNGVICSIDCCSQPEPILIPFEQLLPHSFFFSRSKVAPPVVLTHLKSFFYIGFRSLKSKGLRVIYRGESGTLDYDNGRQQRADEAKRSREMVHRNLLISRNNAVA